MRVGIIAALVAALLVSGCGSGGRETPGRRTVVAAFYPLAWAAEQVAGAAVEVGNLTPPGVEPHDLELSARDVERVRGADLVVYVGGGFMAALEDALEHRPGPSLDVHGDAPDPHVWLDPRSFSAVASAIAEALGDPSRADPLLARLEQLDRELHDGLTSCARREIVTSHAAFGSLAAAYGLRQIALTGISPEAEPTPRALERLVDQVRASGATTVFAEPLVSSRLARTVAREAEVEVAVLDPIEGLSEERLAAGEDYVSVMRDNLATLREALGCR